jgi:hypothetical protein
LCKIFSKFRVEGVAVYSSLSMDLQGIFEDVEAFIQESVGGLA